MIQIKTENIIPLTDLQRAPGKVVSRAASEPVIITQHGRPAVVMVDCKTFEELEKNAQEKKNVGPEISERESNLRNELQRITCQIINLYKPEKIILFGSLARGLVTDSSDIDLVIIKNTKKTFWERQKELLKLIRPKLACDMLVYTPEEWEKFIVEESNFVAGEIKDKGKIIYERAA